MGAVLEVGNLGDEGEVQASNEEAFEADIPLVEALEAREVQLEAPEQAEKYESWLILFFVNSWSSQCNKRPYSRH